MVFVEIALVIGVLGACVLSVFWMLIAPKHPRPFVPKSMIDDSDHELDLYDDELL